MRPKRTPNIVLPMTYLLKKEKRCDSVGNDLPSNPDSIALTWFRLLLPYVCPSCPNSMDMLHEYPYK
jgi:hypothetical protein